MIPTTEETAALHAEFNRITNQHIRYDMSRHFAWEAWVAAGYTVEDLRLVIAYIWRRIKVGKRERESFKLSALIGSRDKFEDDLGMARSDAMVAAKNRPVPSNKNKASVLASAGITPKPPVHTAKSAQQILKESEFVKQHLAEWRKANPL